MASKQLKNKPLVEAIMEMRWELQTRSPGYDFDPHYKLLLGRLFDRVQADYPHHEQLPTASVPDEMVGQMIQHRFRVGDGLWPLIQVGPGIFAVNSTSDYTWADFRAGTLSAVEKLYGAHPKVADLKITSLVLRYFDAVEFDYAAEDVYSFMEDKLKIGLSLPRNLFGETGVQDRPDSFIWQSTFKCSRPEGTVTVRFASGKKGEKPAIVWETTVQSSRSDVPEMPNQFEHWIDAAHTITDDWFFKLIEGELESRFSNG